MKLMCDDQDRYSVFTLKGELTQQDGATLRREVNDRVNKHLCDFVLDMSELEFADSAGLELLLWLQERCNEQFGQVRLAGCTETVGKILELTRLDTRLQCNGTTEEAIASLHDTP